MRPLHVLSPPPGRLDPAKCSLQLSARETHFLESRLYLPGTVRGWVKKWYEKWPTKKEDKEVT